MKKFLLIFTLLWMAFEVNAQQTTKAYLLVNGGMNYATFYQSSRDVNSLTGVWGPEVGLSVRTVTPAWWGFEGGVNYSTKGTNFSDSLGKIHVNYAGVFFDGLLAFPLENNDDVFLGAGIYGNYALTGNEEMDSLKTNIQFGDTFKKLDLGFQLRGCYMIKNTIGVGVHYEIGFTPVYSGYDLRGGINHGRNSVFTFFASLKLAKIFDR